MAEPAKCFTELVQTLSQETQPQCLRKAVRNFHNQKQWNEAAIERLLLALANCMSTFDGAEAIVETCPLLVLPLLAVASKQKSWNAQVGVLSLGTLAKLHPDAHRFALHNIKGPNIPFENEVDNTEPPQAKKKKGNLQRNILQACLSLLKVDRQHFARIWNCSSVVDLLFSQDNDTKWLACEILALVLGMPETSRLTLQKRFFKDETRRKMILQGSMCKRKISSCPLKDLSSCFEVLCSTCPGVTFVSGIPLPALQQKTVAAIEDGLVMVASTQANLRSLAVAAAAGRPVLLQGPVGCGKTALVEHLAALTGRLGPPDLLRVQLGDETDSKMLLGAYRCTEVPGEFVWRPGILTQAVQQGAWLLLEDVDCASMDVVSVLASLIETGTLSVPGYRDCVPAAPSFQLFATQRLVQGFEGLHRSRISPSASLDELWLQLSVEPLARHELQTVIETKFPSLSTVAPRLLDVFLLFSQGSHAAALEATALNRPAIGMDDAPEPTNPKLAGRLISTRDLLKWCARSATGFDASSPDCALRLLQDAIDLFCCSAPSADERLRLATAVAGRLGIVSTKAMFFCFQHKPTVNISPSKISAGRATIQRVTSAAAGLESGAAVFSLTRAASCLLERVACCVSRAEPVLLVGETGAGKTATVQLLSRRAGRQLRVLNMNQHSDSSDLLGGFKPVDLKLVIGPVRDEFERLFCLTFKRQPNLKFLEHIATCFGSRRWDTLTGLMRHSLNAALRKTLPDDSLKDWRSLSDRLERLESQLRAGHASLAFSFIEGALVRAVETGEWVLLDEINLASAETLQCLSGLLEGSTGSLHLLEKGDEKPVTRHPDFRLFACMNPATDVGKKDLPPGLRNRFTELYVEELTEKSDLIQLSGCYLSGLGLSAPRLESVVKLYLQLRTEAGKNLSSGTGHRPHFSLRTLCRALAIAAVNPCGSVSRSLLEAFNLSFLTQLDGPSQSRVEQLIIKAVCGKESKSVIGQPLPEPTGAAGSHIKVEGFWVSEGGEKISIPDNYILTLSVRSHLKALARAVSLGRAPVLLQGETSVGKTSLVSYLARITGHRCLRINNHEHTDLQEYLGQYVAGSDGQLTFREGALVEAMRRGHWVILDELNLAPSDVLEALNRVLDDNRELFIPETQTLVQAHPKFMLFATQNPPGLYGGRKVLSRAFRNRFVELHFTEIPAAELEIILQKRCALPASYAKRMVAVMGELQLRRRGSAAFAGKQGFMTLRDLFRWGERYRLAAVATPQHDWEQHLADEGYLVLAGRVRRTEEATVIEEALQKHLKCKVSPDNLFTLGPNTSAATRQILEEVTSASVPGFEHVVWTFNMRRLAVLVGKAVQFEEPALLVGETGCGKTSVCQLLAALRGRGLSSVNCHMHTEAADFLGSLRPVRDHQDEDRLFEWSDGPLVQAMSRGDWFLADEISLADDSVLERLNSLLEPERSLLLAEKGGECVVTACPGFQFVATMNPGGDFGKKELSPALRNRLTEVWCEGCEDRDDRIAVVEKSLRAGLALGNQQDGSSGVGRCAADFVSWLRQTELGSRLTVSVRDLLTWVHFANAATEHGLDLGSSYVHGACLTFLDSLGAGPTSGASGWEVAAARKAAVTFLESQVERETGSFPTFSALSQSSCKIQALGTKFGIQPFYIEIGDAQPCTSGFLFEAPSTCTSVLRLLRALQLAKPVLLEGSPGVGKTSLVHALASAAGHHITRINLSDQTDASDLFGADLPVEGGVGGQFAWRDGPFLQALKAGHWIVLDELNLASQSVLEALNACLDHRGEVYIPELGRSFRVKTNTTRLFACQNPQRQGGARRGLPRSFLNRFTQVFIEALTPGDLEFIARASFSDLPVSLLSRMVRFTCRVAHETSELRTWGARGGPWDLNLRDLARWAAAARLTDDCRLGPDGSAALVYVARMRTQEDRAQMVRVYEEEVGQLSLGRPKLSITPEHVTIGGVKLVRGGHCKSELASKLLLLRSSLPTLHALSACVQQNWLSVLVGGPGSGKSSNVQLLAALTGQPLRVLAVNAAMDTTEILGGFEQTDFGRHLDELASSVEQIVGETVTECLIRATDNKAKEILGSWEQFRQVDGGLQQSSACTLSHETRLFERRVTLLEQTLVSLGPSGSQLLKQLRELSAKARSAGALNAGGRFEWVDSVLVKCLRDGNWLLVENVNLCSAAVLDRLNGLLEPGGRLVLGERGARPEGGLFEVTPHPNFRLFFTMDPRHGDISRAMRNRGVEIFVPSPGENTPPLDLCALLTMSGVDSHEDQRLLLAAHQALRSLTSAAAEATSSLPLLLRAAFLTRENAIRGAGTRSLRLACIDVYVKPRSSAEAKKQALAVLDQVLSSYDEPPSPYDLLPSTATLHVHHLQRDSQLAVLQHQGALLVTVDQAQHVTESSSFLNRLCHLTSGREYKLSHIVHPLLLAFYLNSSPTDLAIRHSWLVARAPSLQPASESLCSAIQEFCPSSRLPWDARWSGSSATANESLAARLGLWLQFLMLRPGEDLDAAEGLTALQYSTLLAERRISESITSSASITQLDALLRLIDKVLGSTLRDITLTPSQVDALHAGLMWRFHLRSYAAQCHLTAANAANVAAALAIHVRWASKRLVQLLLKLTPKNGKLGDMVKELQALLVEIGREDQHSPLSRVSRKVLPRLGQPPPLRTESQAAAVNTVDGILEDQRLWPQTELNKWTKLTSWLVTDKGLELRRELITASININFRRETSDEALNRLRMMAKEFETFDLVENRAGGEWIARERLCVLMATQVRREVLQNGPRREELLRTLLDMLSVTRSIPCKVQAAIESLLQSPESKACAQYVISTTLDWQARRSPSTVAPYLWLDWCHPENMVHSEKQNVISRQLQAQNEKRHLSVGPQCPILSLVVTRETLGSEISIGNSDAQNRRLDSLGQLVWTGTQASASPNFSVRQNEIASVKAAFSQLLIAINPEMNSSLSLVDQVASLCIGPLSPLQSSLAQLASLLDEHEACGLALAGRAWVLLGYITLTLASALPALDPVHTRGLKLQYTLLELEHHERTLYVHELLSRVTGETTQDSPASANPHPLLTFIKQHCANLVMKRDKFAAFIAKRPDNCRYAEILTMVRHYAASLAAAETALSLVERLMFSLESNKVNVPLLAQEQGWQASQRKFCDELSATGALYPDLVQPVLCGASQLSHGMALLSAEVRQCSVRDGLSDLGSKCSLPSLSESVPSHLDVAKTTLELANLLDINKSETVFQVTRLQLCALEELRNDALCRGCLRGDVVAALSKLLGRVAEAWKRQEEERVQLEKEKQSMYRSKSTDGEEKSEIRRAFPSFHHEFSDVAPGNNLMDTETIAEESEPDVQISSEDLGHVGQLHAEVFTNFTQRDWLSQSHNVNVSPRLAGPLLQRLHVLKSMASSDVCSLDPDLDQQLTASYMLLLHYTEDPNIGTKPHDFYRDPFPSETLRCKPLVTSVQQRVKELMKEWPEHPTLITLDTVCTRVLSFSRNSPLARLLCGLELLLSHLQSWESHAHAGVSLGVQCQAVSQLVLEWRRLELQRWSSALDTVQEIFEKKSLGRWWSHLVALLLEETKSGETCDLISAIQQFMEQSQLGDFTSRLRLMQAFHCHALHLPQSPHQDRLQRVLWNAHVYYSQFTPAVVSKLKSKRVPIEKKLREAVKIARWTDTNYWALRQTVEKTHRTLFKYMREYQAILSESASPAMTVPNDPQTDWNVPFQPSDYISIIPSPVETEGGVAEVSRWFKKAQKLSKEVLLTAPYPRRVHSLNQFACSVADTIHIIQSQEVLAEITDKKQRKGQLKHLLQRKRKTLADLLKSLSRIGLSYRFGLAQKQDHIIEAFLSTPFNLQVLIEGTKSIRPADKTLLTSWNGCSKLLSASLARLAQLKTALEKPSSDLGPLGIEKMQGFSLHLMESTRLQYSLLIKLSTQLYSLKRLLNPLNDMPIFPTESAKHIHDEAVEVVSTSISWLEQCTLLLNSLPRPVETPDNEFIPGFPAPTSQQITEASAVINSQTKNKLISIRNELLSIKLNSPLISKNTIQQLMMIGTELSSISTNLKSLETVLPSFTQKGLCWLRNKLTCCADKLEAITDLASVDDSSSENKVTEQAELLHTKCLLILQRLYHHHVSSQGDSDHEDQPGEEDDEVLEEGQLQSGLIASLQKDIEDLKLHEFETLIQNLLKSLPSNQAYASVVRGCLPLLDQALLMMHYLTAQLTSSLHASTHLLTQFLNLATILVHKGFNMPEEVMEDSGEGPTQPGQQGLGLGEGEGEKDVSDRLESEDQLEGARQEGDEKEESADKDVKEEEGVEVSEDFDGKLQDKEPAEGEGDDEESDDEDTGKEIGETGEGAECLDKEVWGSDSEEEEGEMGESDQGRGQKNDDVTPEVGAGDEEHSEQPQEQKDWDAQQQQEFPEDQTDTQHSKHAPLEEPEALELPDDLKLDGGEEEDQGEEEETENPFETQEISDIKEAASQDDKEEQKDEKDASGNESDSEMEQDNNPEGQLPEETKGDDEGNDAGGTEDVPQPLEGEQDSGEQDDKAEEEVAGAHTADASAEPAPAKGSSDSSAQNDTTAVQQEQTAGGDAGEDKGQEGAAQAEEGHASASQADSSMAAPASLPKDNKKSRERRRPGEADDAHMLGDTKQPALKRLRLAEGRAENDGEDSDDGHQKDENEGDLHQHVKEAKEHSLQTMDAATQEQAMQQKPAVADEGSKEELMDDDVDVLEDAKETPTTSCKEIKPETSGEKPGDVQGKGENEGEGTEQVTVEGETVSTESVQRGGACTFHTLDISYQGERQELTAEQVAALRLQLEQQLATWSQPPASAEAAQAWTQFSAATSGLARELCEQLRLVLEPTQASRLRGDYRTGRRINMRKVIPYIASEFRKDKIWLRRTKPSRRTYQVVLALDDSSSMADNHSKELAFESLALVSQALTLLEAGELGVLSFGEEPKVLHQLGETFTEDSGARLVQQLTFAQRQTRVGRLVDFVTTLMMSVARQSQELAQLLVIVSDGRGVFSEGKESVTQAVRAAREARIFIVFLAIEDPNSKDSIMDIRTPIFVGGKLLGISSYLDDFPFPYYLVLRDVESLPGVLSDALRQWFELAVTDQ